MARVAHGKTRRDFSREYVANADADALGVYALVALDGDRLIILRRRLSDDGFEVAAQRLARPSTMHVCEHKGGLPICVYRQAVHGEVVAVIRKVTQVGHAAGEEADRLRLARFGLGHLDEEPSGVVVPKGELFSDLRDQNNSKGTSELKAQKRTYLSSLARPAPCHNPQMLLARMVASLVPARW